MGRYLTPPNPYDELETGCLRIYYPDNPFFYRALWGQITELESRWIWDTDGDIDAANHIEQLWRGAGAITRQNELLGCGDIEECEQTIIDLTIQLEQCQDALQELENMQINVNCNCGCCGNPINLPEPIADNGSPIETVTVPIDPNDPLGEDVPTWDDETETPPDGFPTWQDYTDNRCLLANWVIDGFLGTVEALDEAENRASVIVDIASLALLLVPLPIGKTKGFMTVVKWVVKLVAFLELVEEPLDYLQWIADAVAERKQDIICDFYNLQSTQEKSNAMVDALLEEIAGNSEYGQMALEAKAKFDDWLTAVVNDIATAGDSWAVKNLIPEDYVPTVDCAQCVVADVYLQSCDQAGVVQQELGVNAGGSVEMTAYANDGYGPYMFIKIVDSQGAGLHLLDGELEITGLNGWVQHNIAQHPFTLQTQNFDGSGNSVLIAQNQPIPLPKVLTGNGGDFGRIQIASNTGTDGFKVTFSRP